MIGGLIDGTNYKPETSMEYSDPADTITTKLMPNRVLVNTLAASYPFTTMIPQTGHIFMFASKTFHVFDANSAPSWIEQRGAPPEPMRSMASGLETSLAAGACCPCEKTRSQSSSAQK